jgi:hypothetical protein
VTLDLERLEWCLEQGCRGTHPSVCDFCRELSDAFPALIARIRELEKKVGNPPPLPNAIDLSHHLFKLADQIGKHEQVEDAIRKNRDATTTSAHLAWLGRQIVRVQSGKTMDDKEGGGR